VTLGQHDGDGIRYAMHLSAPKGGSAQMLRDPAGGWVSWEDYARLKAEVERLTKAGDDLETWVLILGHNNPTDIEDFRLVVLNWNAAKEGKQS
jgi:hypothetical protein